MENLRDLKESKFSFGVLDESDNFFMSEWFLHLKQKWDAFHFYPQNELSFVPFQPSLYGSE